MFDLFLDPYKHRSGYIYTQRCTVIYCVCLVLVGSISTRLYSKRQKDDFCWMRIIFCEVLKEYKINLVGCLRTSYGSHNMQCNAQVPVPCAYIDVTQNWYNYLWNCMNFCNCRFSVAVMVKMHASEKWMTINATG